MPTCRVFKYPVPVTDEFELTMHDGSAILTVQVQNDNPQLWALCDETAPLVRRRFRLAGTGDPIEDADHLEYIGTFQILGGRFVSHLFERT